MIDAENFPPVMPTKGCTAEVTIMIKKGNTMKVACGYSIEAKVKQV